jgi:hypothetical protein
MIRALWEPSPWFRALASGIALGGVMFTKDVLALVALLMICSVLLWAQGHFIQFVRFLLRIWMPVALGLMLVWGVVVQGSPDAGYRSGPTNGYWFALLVATRLAALAALFQTAVLSLRGIRLAHFLKSVGLSPSITAMLVSIFNLWPDFSRRTEQVVAARCARGLMPDRRLITRVRQVPWVLRTLFVGSLAGSLDRVDRWESDQLPQRLFEAAKIHAANSGNIMAGVLWCLIASVWTASAIWLGYR